MKTFTISAILFIACICLNAQNLIGYKGAEIIKYMKANHREMNYNRVVNKQFNYLKYSDDSESQTILFFLNADSVCRNVKVIIDPEIKPGKVNELNALYTRSDNNRWIDRHGGKVYHIDLKDEKWSCVISYETEK